jgi:ribosomal protein L7/L12
MDETDRFRALLKDGRSRDDALSAMRRAGASPIGCIKAIHEVEQVSLAEAKRLFSESASWADIHRSHEAFADELETLATEFAATTTIYVPLRDEGVAVW